MSDDGEESKVEGPDKVHEIPPVWALKDGEFNPYLHNVFVLLGIDPDADERTLARQRERIKRRLEASSPSSDSSNNVVHGRQVSISDVSRLETLETKVAAFVAERLLVHTNHQADQSAFRESLKHVKKLALEDPADLLPLRIEDLSFLSEFAPDLEQVVAGEPAPPAPQDFRAAAAGRLEPEEIWDG